MAKVKDNPITAGASGKLGKLLVFRRMKDGRTIIATLPNYTNHKWTPDQKTHHNRFQEAAAYARSASKTKPIYAQRAAGTSKNAYNVALADWFHPPVIHEVSRQAGCIRVSATDDVQVARVLITILDGHGQSLEQGQAARINDSWWEFETAIPAEGKVSVEAFDLAGNCTRHEA
jgi:hypothetical protein